MKGVLGYFAQSKALPRTADTTPSGGHPEGIEKLSFDWTLLIDAGMAHGRSVVVGFCDDHDPVPDSGCPFGLFRCDGLILNSYGLRRKLKFFQRMNHFRISVIGPVAVMVKATNGLVHSPSRIHGKPQSLRYVGWLCLPRSSATAASKLAIAAGPMNDAFQKNQTADGDMT